MLFKQKQNQEKENFERRFSNRSISIFSAIGQMILGMYLELGPYIIGAANAAMVSWEIGYSQAQSGKPAWFFWPMAVIIFMAVEGLTILLVGAASVTGSKLLWVLSIFFGLFFSFGHYQEMVSDKPVIGQYVVLMAPLFVISGYYGQTLKNKMETAKAKAELIEENTSERQSKREDDQIAFEREQAAIKMRLEHEKEMAELAAKQAIKIAEAEAKAQAAAAVAAVGVGPAEKQKVSTEERQEHVLRVARENPDAGPTKILKLLSNEGLEVSLSTVKRDIKELNGKLHKVEA